MLSVRELCAADVPDISARQDGGPAWHGGIAKWSDYWDQHQRGLRISMIATDDDQIVGYGSLVWQSQYPVFAAEGLPEVQDMVVAQAYRRRGIAAAMVASFEDRAREAGRRAIGIGVGLYPDYGAAQRLYVRLGYTPDGRGVTFNGVTVPPGAPVTVNDELVLWLSKQLT